jgi:Domain of unknown function (DUF4333)
VVAVAAGGLLGGCGTARVDTAKAERAISQGIEQRFGVTGVQVSCPADVKARKGDRFTCTARAKDGSHAVVRVVQLTDDGRIRWRTALAFSDRIERAVAAALSRQLRQRIRLECPQLIALRAGAQVTCRGIDAKGRRAPVAVTLPRRPGERIRYRVTPG